MEVFAPLQTPVQAARQSVGYHPSVWGDFFINNPPSPPTKLAILKQRSYELKVEVKNLLKHTTDPLQELELIDQIQRLGVAYHFENEINDKLYRIQQTSFESDDIHAVALYFRLLRQQRCAIPCDVFNKFLDAKGEFMASLSKNTKALLSLYEAAYLCMPGEEILDKAVSFSRGHLKRCESNLEPYYKLMVSSALDLPLVRRVDRLRSKLYLSIYEKDGLCNRLLLEFAKIDFALLQELYHDEVRHLSIWWKDSGVVMDLPFTRDRIVECFFWILSIYHEPCYSRARLMMTKLLALISLTDDIYDTYGTVEELKLFTDVIKRWDLERISNLPNFMQQCFQIYDNTFNEFEDELKQEQYSFRVHYLKEEFKTMTQAYFEEVKWASQSYVPKLMDHLKISLITAGHCYITCGSYVGIEEEIPNEVFEWVAGVPPILKSSCIVGRLMNDIVSYEFERNRNHFASSIESYAMEHGCLEEEACIKLKEMVEDDLKIINKEFIFSKFPMAFIKPILNITNFNMFIYKDTDMYTNSTKVMKDNITNILVEPIQTRAVLSSFFSCEM